MVGTTSIVPLDPGPKEPQWEIHEGTPPRRYKSPVSHVPRLRVSVSLSWWVDYEKIKEYQNRNSLTDGEMNAVIGERLSHFVKFGKAAEEEIEKEREKNKDDPDWEPECVKSMRQMFEKIRSTKIVETKERAFPFPLELPRGARILYGYLICQIEKANEFDIKGKIEKAIHYLERSLSAIKQLRQYHKVILPTELIQYRLRILNSIPIVRTRKKIVIKRTRLKK